MTWLFVVVAIGVLAFVFLVVLGPLGELPPVEPDLKPELVEGEPRFDVVVRGYRMDEVDQQVATMQERIAALEAQLGPQLDPTLEPLEPQRQPQFEPQFESQLEPLEPQLESQLEPLEPHREQPDASA